jgi:hypothetical protein
MFEDDRDTMPPSFAESADLLTTLAVRLEGMSTMLTTMGTDFGLLAGEVRTIAKRITQIEFDVLDHKRRLGNIEFHLRQTSQFTA